ncbi:MAG: hypothetical protein NTX49_04715 [Chlamydiae bacterium]|nr:hypothetical protein [Chlamydiota bacterium]
MTNFTCPIGSNPFDAAAPLMPMTLAAPIGDSVPSVGLVVEQVARAVFPVIAAIAAPYVAARLPQAIQAGTQMMMNGIAIPVRGFNDLRDSWNQYRRGVNVIQAAEKGNTDLVTSLLASGQISDKDRGLAIIAAELHFLDAGIITALLASGQISNEDRGLATKYAATLGNVEMLRSLLASGEISNEDRGSALVEAVKTLQAQHGSTAALYPAYAEIVTMLLASGQISNEDRGVATDWAANGGIGNLFNGYAGRIVHVGIVTSLLTSGEISEEHRGRAVVGAARSNHEGMVTLLLNGLLPGCGPIDQYHRGCAVDQAARSGNIDMVTRLLDQRYPITDEVRGDAACHIAYWGGDRRILQLLLASGGVSFSTQSDRVRAATSAAKHGYDEFLKLILASGPLHPEDFGMAVREAAYNNREGCVRLLLSYGLIREGDRIIARDWTPSPAIKALLGNQQNCQTLFTEGQRLRNDRNLVLNDIERNADAIRVAIPGFRNNADFILAAAARNGLVLRYIPEGLRTIEVLAAAVGQNPAARQWVPEAFTARDLAEIATNPSLFPLLPEAEITSERAQRAIEFNPLFLRFVPAAIQAGLELDILTSAVRKNPAALNLIEPVLLTEDIVNTVIQMPIDPANVALLAARPAALRSLADKVIDGTINRETASAWMLGLAQYFCDDKVFMIFAITHCGIELSVASGRLKDDEDVVLAAIRIVRSDWNDASARLKAHPTPAILQLLA